MSKPNFFQWSITHHNSPMGNKIKRLYGWEGYGWYMGIIQVLGDSPERKLKIEDVPDIAYGMKIDETHLFKLIQDFLTVTVDGYFFSLELEAGVATYVDKVSRLNAVKGGTTAAANKTPNQLLEHSLKMVKAKKEKKSKVNVVDGSLTDSIVLKSIEEDSNVDDGTVINSKVLNGIVSDGTVQDSKGKESKVVDSVIEYSIVPVSKQVTGEPTEPTLSVSKQVTGEPTEPTLSVSKQVTGEPISKPLSNDLAVPSESPENELNIYYTIGQYLDLRGKESVKLTDVEIERLIQFEVSYDTQSQSKIFYATRRVINKLATGILSEEEINHYKDLYITTKIH